MNRLVLSDRVSSPTKKSAIQLVQVVYGVPGLIRPMRGQTVFRINFLFPRMADDKQGRDDQADDAERRQRERELEEARNRGDEAEPIREDPGEQLGNLDEALQTHEYPTTTEELINAYGDYEIEIQDGRKPLDEVLAQTDNQTYDSADDARSRIQGLIHR